MNRKVAARLEGMLDWPQLKAFIDRCLDEGIDTIQVPELDEHKYFKGTLSLLNYSIYSGQMDSVYHLKEAGYPFAKPADQCPPLVTALIFNQLAIA